MAGFNARCLLVWSIAICCLSPPGYSAEKKKGNQASDASPPSSDQVAETRESITKLLAHLDQSGQALSKVEGYTAAFLKQEATDKKLQDPESISLKIRHRPFSVYMKWEESGQEVLFVEGKNDGKLLAKPTGLASLVGTVRLDPDSKDAMRNSRYPITEAGIGRLVARIKKFYSQFENPGEILTCRYSEQKSGEAPIDVFEIVFRDEKESPDYQSSRLVFDQKSKILVSVENFGWPRKEGKAPQVVERYQFQQLNFGANLTDTDFDEKNPDYKF